MQMFWSVNVVIWKCDSQLKYNPTHCFLWSRNIFDEDQVPASFAKDVMQDVHSVSSLLKMYFRELPNPLLTYQLYNKFIVSYPCLLLSLIHFYVIEWGT